MTTNKIPCVLTIAGTDPSGGAGIQADIKTISATGAYAASVMTALVAQNTQGVQDIFSVPPEFIWQQLMSVSSDLHLAAIKIGMLHNAQVIATVAAFLASQPCQHVVFDPVMVAKNGCALLQPDTIAALKDTFISKTTLITPNLPEAETLLARRIETPDDMAQAANELATTYQVDVLLKGGHLPAAQAALDVFQAKTSKQPQWLQAPRIATLNTHGTGCTLSAAIASYLAQGLAPFAAIAKAKDYLTAAIKAADALRMGRGRGPVDHFYFLANRNQYVSTPA